MQRGIKSVRRKKKKMKAINKQAKKVMDVLIEGVDIDADDSKKIDNTKGTFMPVHIEYVTNCELGAIYSVAHYYEQNGDLMRDPDMEFLKGGDGEYYPISFWQDSPIVRDEPVEWGEGGEIERCDDLKQIAMISFANRWMKNIKQQQGLVV